MTVLLGFADVAEEAAVKVDLKGPCRSHCVYYQSTGRHGAEEGNIFRQRSQNLNSATQGLIFFGI